MRHESKGKRHTFYYDSVTEYMEKALAEKPDSGKFNDYRYSRNEEVKDWNGNKTWEQTVEMQACGWPEGAEKVAEISASVGKTRPEYVQTSALAYDTAGAMVDVGAFMTGDPECFLNFANQAIIKPVVRMGVQIGANCDLKAEDLLNRGAAILALVEALEFARTAVEIHAYTSNSGRGESYFVEDILVKRSEEPLDIDKLSYVLSFAGFFRRVSFSVWETYSELIRKDHGIREKGGYGCTKTINARDAKRLRYDIYPKYDPEQYKTPEASAQFVKQMAEQAGVNIEE